MSGMNLLEILVSAQVWAAEAGHGADHHVPAVSEVILPAANFLIYAAVIYYFAIPPVREFLKSRREEIVSAITQAAAKKQAAEAMVGEYRAKVAGLDKEIQLIHGALRSEGEQEKARLVREAQTTAAKIKEDARFLADQEVKIARQKVRQDMADRAEAAARELVQRHLSTADQSRLAEDFIQNIGQVR